MSLFRCPKCQEGKLFNGLLKIHDACPQCQLPLAKHEQGDGPAVLGILIVGAVVAVASVMVEVKYEPPVWVHALVWPPVILVGSVVCLRWLKAVLIGWQYRHRRGDFS